MGVVFHIEHDEIHRDKVISDSYRDILRYSSGVSDRLVRKLQTHWGGNKRKVFEFINEGKDFASWPFDKRFHLLLNIAVGGNWGGAQGVDPTVYPQSMEVDYVRVYKLIEG